MPIIDNLIIVGVGGTGSKIIEALIHLAPSGNAPKNIIPIIIDQDSTNGNKKRCTNLIKTYYNLQNKASSDYKDGKLFKSNIDVHNRTTGEPLTIIPEDIKNNYAAAIGFNQMSDLEKKLINATYSSAQMNGKLDYGYKKRAFLGSALIGKMIQNEEKKKHDEKGLKEITNKYKNYNKDNIQVVICGSIFGGTGASGIVKVGDFFKKYMPNINIKAFFLLPYYKISNEWETDDQDKGLIKSDSDMIAAKVVLDMFTDEIKQSFDSVYMLGTTRATDNVSDIAHSGGDKQENPAHIFELLAALGASTKTEISTSNVYNYIYDSSAKKEIDRYKFDFNSIDSNESLKKMRNFASLLTETENHPNSWKIRQSWYLNKPDSKEENSTLLAWAKNHNAFFKQMKSNWHQFYFDDKIHNESDLEGIQQQQYKLSATLSINSKCQNKSIADVLKTLDKL